MAHAIRERKPRAKFATRGDDAWLYTAIELQIVCEIRTMSPCYPNVNLHNSAVGVIYLRLGLKRSVAVLEVVTSCALQLHSVDRSVREKVVACRRTTPVW